MFEVQRAVLLTSIDVGALRGDLGDRIVLVDLGRIPADSRRPKRMMDETWKAARPRILGALLDLLARVLKVLPELDLDRLPRMADFARVVAAVDRELGTNGLARLEAQSLRIAEEVIEGDPVGEAVCEFVRKQTLWTGSAKELLQAIAPKGPTPPEWPKTAKGLGGRLRRVAPALREIGVEVVPPAENDRPRFWNVRLLPTGSPVDPAPEGRAPARGYPTDRISS